MFHTNNAMLEMAIAFFDCENIPKKVCWVHLVEATVGEGKICGDKL